LRVRYEILTGSCWLLGNSSLSGEVYEAHSLVDY
jgi:hypothetical protein